MLRSLFSAISGLQNFQERLDVIGNNVANVNTTGFKSSRVDFADSFSQTLRASSPSSGPSSGVAGLQVGTGVLTTAIKSDYRQGAVARTGLGTDLALAGEGFFVVRDPVSANEFVTRSGDFRVDDRGFLITNSGLRVQGWSDASLAGGSIGDIQIDATDATGATTTTPAQTLVSFSIDDQGRVNVALSNSTQFVRGQILLQNVTDPQALLKEGNNLYSGLGSAGPLGGATPTPEAPGTFGLGKIYSGALELSNVDLATEFTNLITTQRAYQANARIITTSDEMLQELVNLKR